MAFWKAWIDVRSRFFLVLILWIVLVGETRLDAANSTVRATEEISAEEPLAGMEADPDLQFQSYGYDRLVVDWTTGQGSGTFSILAILLAVGGVLGRASGRPDILTLSFPVPPTSWLWAQAGVAALLLLALGFLEGGSVILTAWGFGLEVPQGSILLACVLTPLSAAIWVWPTIMAMVLLRDSIRAAILIIIAFVASSTPGVLGPMARPYFRNIADVSLWQGGLPWGALLGGLALTGLTAWVALRRFQAMEF